MKEKIRKGFRRLGSRSLIDDDQGVILALGMLILGIIVILVIIKNIIPIIIFMVLAIILALVVKHLLFGRRSLGIARGVAGFTREVGREFVPMARQAGGAFGRLIGR